MGQLSRTEIVRRIEDTGVVGIIRMKDPDRLLAVIDAVARGGVAAIEITMTVPGAVDLLKAVRARVAGELLLGAGTVLDPETAREVILAGAQFIVAPTFNPDVIRLGHRYDIPVLPGCFTPTEILAAWEAGADIVKVFPATTVGPGYLKDVHAPLPQVRLMPTGGVTVSNAADWIRAGAVAVGVGSALLDPGAIAAGEFDRIAAAARQLVDNVRAARSARPA